MKTGRAGFTYKNNKEVHMGAFIMLVIIGLAVIWILLSRHFEQIGRFFSGMSPGDKDEKESEEHDVKEER